jgi:hypothetical protein
MPDTWQGVRLQYIHFSLSFDILVPFQYLHLEKSRILHTLSFLDSSVVPCPPPLPRDRRRNSSKRRRSLLTLGNLNHFLLSLPDALLSIIGLPSSEKAEVTAEVTSAGGALLYLGSKPYLIFSISCKILLKLATSSSTLAMRSCWFNCARCCRLVYSRILSGFHLGGGPPGCKGQAGGLGVILSIAGRVSSYVYLHYGSAITKILLTRLILFNFGISRSFLISVAG